jgi:transcriptional regulator with XRE-family HTH domain
MSPRAHRAPISEPAARALSRLAGTSGQAIHEERIRRALTLRSVAERAGVSTSIVQELESGRPVSLETYARVTTALDLRPELLALDPRQRQSSRRGSQDFVHAAMGELEAARFRGLQLGIAMDEPYQHYQFAGRADVVAWDVGRRALLHIENRTAFPNVQEALGSYSAKRSYLADVMAERLSIPGGRWAAVLHCVIALWSAEVLHTLRLRIETFRSACPDPAAPFLAWWATGAEGARGVSSTLVLLDPAKYLPDRRRFASLDDALRVRPRYRDYADAAERLRR